MFLPSATLRPARRVSWAWLITLAAAVFAGWLAWRAWIIRGLAVTVQLADGRGLKAGDDVRYRGIVVGTVDRIGLAPDLDGVLAHIRLTSQADKLARSGSRFWVVRPQLRLTHIEGLETLIGPRYLAALPATAASAQELQPRSGPYPPSDRGWGAPQRYFVGLDEPPAVESIQPGDLEIILQAAQRGSLHRGAPVLYRQTRVGTILSVGLAGDGGAVEARAHIEKSYAALIRPQTRFWDVGGIQARLGFTGLNVEIQSAEALLSGGVALATPPSSAAGEMVRTGHRFELASKPDESWLTWQPMVPIGSALLPTDAPPPTPLRATLGWSQGRIGNWLMRERSRQGWLLQTEHGLLGPADLLEPDARAEPSKAVLEVAGAMVSLEQTPSWADNGLALLPAQVAPNRWPAARLRCASAPEECIAIADPAADPLPLAASRLTLSEPASAATSTGRTWSVDPAVPVDSAWHGACVVARADGSVVGMLLIQRGTARVALLPEKSPLSRPPS